mmetsp:Transcript_34719/g.53279  ORF Transcript_34719/g.53279 Transcript_34719/m.53279 type:complete len:249 (-) Transcript_34719:1195-1941(-)
MNCEMGFLREQVVDAGKAYTVVVDIPVAGSVLCLNFETVDYDIRFALYKATAATKFKVENVGDDSKMIEHLVEGEDGMTEVLPPVYIDSKEQLHNIGQDFSTSSQGEKGSTKINDGHVRISYRAKAPGLYCMVFSNEHSWLRSKTLKYRYSILEPVDSSSHPENVDTEPSSTPTVEIKLSSEQVNPLFDQLTMKCPQALATKERDEPPEDEEVEVSGVQLRENLVKEQYDPPTLSTSAISIATVPAEV